MKATSRLLFFTVFTFTSLFFTSCGGDEAVNNGTSTGNYLPLAVNNKWNYVNQYDQAEDIFIIKKENLNNKEYYRVDTEKISAELGYLTKIWFGKSGAKYFSRTVVEMPDYGLTVSPMEVIILRDDLEINQTWTQNFKMTIKIAGQGSQSVAVAVNGKIVEKDIAMTIKGVNYSNIIKSYVKINIDGSIAENNYWFAKDVGIVKTETIQNGASTITELVNYTLY
jgi:sulfur carrier protein ThiS